MSTPEESSKSAALFTRDYILMCINNLSHSVAVNILMPVLPLYLVDDLGLQSGLVGLVLSMYAMGSFAVRPVSGYLSDTLPLKALFMVTGIIYAIFLPFYLMVPFLLLAAIRLVQGISFGIANTAQNTIAVGIIPRSRLGSGLGIYSSMTALGMVLGPMLGMKVLEWTGYNVAFWMAFVLAVASVLVAAPVKLPKNENCEKQKFSWEALIFKRGVPASLCYACVVIGYGMIINYIAIFAREAGPEYDAGLFYGALGLGLILSRVFGGVLLEKGYLLITLVVSKIFAGACLLAMVLIPSPAVFLGTGLLMGLCYGLIMPSYQTIVVQMAEPSQWGAANSTYFFAMDLGMMTAMLAGGVLADFMGFGGMFLSSLLPLAVSLVWFFMSIYPSYKAHMAARG
jgi:predicted MFS family arabinose efflux permease